MGVFLNVLTAPGASKQELLQLLSGVDKKTAESWRLDVPNCQLWQADKGAGAVLSDFCCGYEEMAHQLSRMRSGPMMLAYIYDDDAWGYYFYDNGWEVDSFCTVPDLLEEVSDREKQRLSGCSAALASYFPVHPEQLDPYLTVWEDGEGDAWQLADFLAALGFALPKEEEAQGNSGDYQRLAALAERNSPESWNEASLCSFCEIIELYQMEHLEEKPATKDLIRRTPEDLRLLVCFLQQYPLPDGLYRLIWQTLELKHAKYGRSAVLYGALREQLLALRPELAELASCSYEALRVELIRALNYKAEHWETLDTLFARPDFSTAFFDDTFVLTSFVRADRFLDPAGSPLFLERICEFYQQNPDAPYACLLRTRFENMLKIFRDKQRRKEEQLAAASNTPILSTIPFFLYWLNTFCGMMDLPELWCQLRQQGGFDLEWGRKFVGFDSKSGMPGCKKLAFSWNKQRFQIRFHLRYLEYIRDGQPLYQPCFFLEDLLKLKNADRFFYLLPLMVPVEDPEPLSLAIEQRLSQAAPFLTNAECRTLASQMAKGLVYHPDLEEPEGMLLDWIWDSAEAEPGIDLENDCPPELDAIFEEPIGLEELISSIKDFCTRQPGDFTRWLAGTVQIWQDTRQAQEALREAMREEEKQAEFLNALPQKVFWETWEKFLVYSCEEHRSQLYPNIYCQNSDTGAFAPVGSVQEFLDGLAQSEPASAELRKKLLNCALGFSMDLKKSSYTADLVYLPQSVYIEPDPKSGFAMQLASMPRRLTANQITSKRLDELIGYYRKGALLRLELCWGYCPSEDPEDVDYISISRPISLVFMRDEDKWACFCFDDVGRDANQLISNPKAYLTSEVKSTEKIPFGLGSVPSYALFHEPDPLLDKLPILFRSVSSSRPDFQCQGIWSMIRDTVYYSREKYILDKRTLGGFPPERAYNDLTARFYLKEYPTGLDVLPEKGDGQHLEISGANRDMPRFYLGRFFQNGLKKLIFHFGPQLHLALLRGGRYSRMVLLDDSQQKAYFAVSDPGLLPLTPDAEVEAASFMEQPAAKGLVFNQLLFLRSSTDLVFACWQNRERLLADPRQFCCGDPCRSVPYEALKAELLALC